MYLGCLCRGHSFKMNPTYFFFKSVFIRYRRVAPAVGTKEIYQRNKLKSVKLEISLVVVEL